jgi:nitroreductase
LDKGGSVTVFEAIDQRKSIRQFLPQPVPRPDLEEILEKALRAPSWGNTQPCKLTIVGGENLSNLRRDLFQDAMSGRAPKADIETPKEWPEDLNRRYKENGRKLFVVLGIGRDDQERRKNHRLNMFGFFAAPQAIYIHIERNLGAYSIFDAGLLAENIALLATSKDLGSCFLAVSVLLADVVRRHTGIPESGQIVMGVAIGYPDWSAPINDFRSEREPMERVVRWARI